MRVTGAKLHHSHLMTDMPVLFASLRYMKFVETSTNKRAFIFKMSVDFVIVHGRRGFLSSRKVILSHVILELQNKGNQYRLVVLNSGLAIKDQ